MTRPNVNYPVNNFEQVNITIQNYIYLIYFVGVIICVIVFSLFPSFANFGKDRIPEALGLVILGMGLTITPKQLATLRSATKPVLLGLFLQFTVMPLSAWAIAKILGLPKLIALGMVLVGSAPGGTASNMVAFLAGADVPLSLTMTSLSTLLAPIFTPFWTYILASSWLEINPLPLFISVLKIVFIPVILGIAIRFWLWKNPPALFLDTLLPLLSAALLCWLAGMIIGSNLELFSHSYWLVIICIAAVALHNICGLILGYFGASIGRVSQQRKRTIAIEVGMQNSGLATVLALAHFDPIVALPGVIFSTWHNLSGSILAGIWRKVKKDNG